MPEETKLFVSIQVKLFIVFLLFGCAKSNLDLVIEHPSENQELEIEKRNYINTAKFFIHHENKFLPLELVIDTGSPFTMLAEPIAISSTRTQSLEISSINQFYQKKFRILNSNFYDNQKRLVFSKQDFKVTDLPRETVFDGIIGNDLLSKKNLFLEVPDKISFIHDLSETKILKEFKKISFKFNGEHIFIEMNFNDNLGHFILDTGAGVSCLIKREFEKKKFTQLGRIKILALSHFTEEKNLYEFAYLCIEKNLCKKNIEFISADLKQFENKIDNIKIMGILGQNWMKYYTIILNFEKQVLYIKER